MEYTGNIVQTAEGKKNQAYPDPATGGDPWTIGYGHTGPEVHEGLYWDDPTCEENLVKDLVWAVECINRHVTVALTQDEFDALVDFVYNVGGPGFTNSTLLKKLEAGDYAGAADEFDKWDHAAGRVVQGLLNRRQRETDLFKQGMEEQS